MNAKLEIDADDILPQPLYHPHRARGIVSINIKPSHEGELHQELGVPSGKKIPAKKLAKAKAQAGPAEKKRIVFAENAKKWGKRRAVLKRKQA